MYTIRLPKGYTFAQLSGNGIVAVVMPPFEADIQVNYGNAPPSMRVKVDKPTMIVQHNVTSGKFRLYMLDKVGGRMMASSFGLANVHPNAQFCWGRGNTEPVDLAGAWDQYWNSPFNMDLTGGGRENYVQRKVDEWMRDEWPKQRDALNLSKKPVWKPERWGDPQPYRAKLDAANRRYGKRSELVQSIRNIMREVDERVEDADPVHRIPLMKRREKAARLYEITLGKRDEALNKAAAIEKKANAPGKVYRDMRQMWGDRKFPEDDGYVSIRSKCITNLKHKLHRAVIAYAIHREKIRLWNGKMEMAQTKFLDAVKEAAKASYAVDHFTTDAWQRAHVYQFSINDVAGAPLLNVPPKMDFIGLMPFETMPPFMQEMTQKVRTQAYIMVKHTHNINVCGNDASCGRREDQISKQCAFMFGRFTEGDIAIVNIGGQVYYVKGNSIVREETYNADPQVFDKMPEPVIAEPIFVPEPTPTPVGLGVHGGDTQFNLRYANGTCVICGRSRDRILTYHHYNTCRWAGQSH